MPNASSSGEKSKASNSRKKVPAHWYWVNREVDWVINDLLTATKQLGTKIPASKLIETVGPEVTAQAWMALRTFKDTSYTNRAINALVYADNTSYQDPRAQLSEFFNSRIRERVTELESEYDISMEEQWMEQGPSENSDNSLDNKSGYVVDGLLKDPILSGFTSKRLLVGREKILDPVPKKNFWKPVLTSDIVQQALEEKKTLAVSGRDGGAYPGTKSLWQDFDEIVDKTLSYAPGAQAWETLKKPDRGFLDLGIIGAGFISASTVALLVPGVGPAVSQAIGASYLTAWRLAGLAGGSTLVLSKLAGNNYNENPKKGPLSFIKIPSLNPGDYLPSDTNETQTDSIIPIPSESVPATPTTNTDPPGYYDPNRDPYCDPSYYGYPESCHSHLQASSALASSSLKAFDSDPLVVGSSNQHAAHRKSKRRRKGAPAASFGNRLSEDTNSSLLMATDASDAGFYKQHDLVAASSGNW